jgi:hypothetical protein
VSREPNPTEALERGLATTGPSHIDELYHTLLIPRRKSHFDEDLQSIRSILGLIVVAKRPLSVPGICALLGINIGEATWARQKLAPVLSESHSGIYAIHPSFVDFLTDRERSNEFFIDAGKHDRSLACGILRVMNGQLREYMQAYRPDHAQ